MEFVTATMSEALGRCDGGKGTDRSGEQGCLALLRVEVCEAILGRKSGSQMASEADDGARCRGLRDELKRVIEEIRSPCGRRGLLWLHCNANNLGKDRSRRNYLFSPAIARIQ